jgi:anti-sigma factor RsiW
MSHKPDDIHAELAALADGTLPQQRRDQLLAQLADSPELAAELEDQRRAVAIIGSLESVHAPTLLRRSIELASAGHAQPASSRSADTPTPRREGARERRRSSRLSPRLAATAALAIVAAAAVTLALTVGGGPSAPTRAPTLLQASSVALRPATLPAPAESAHNSHLLAESADGIHYPYWGARLGWSATGARTDTAGGRTITTVFYADGRARRIGYSIVSGAALAIPSGGSILERHGVRFHIVGRANPTVLTWREAGHTCILTAHGVGAGTLVHLATWDRA